jgi:hypothetical protein
MWSTRLEWGDGEWRVHLLRDGAPVAEMSLDEWADLDATRDIVREVSRGQSTLPRRRRRPNKAPSPPV